MGGSCCCKNLSELVRVKFPESLTKLLPYAFSGCIKLKDVIGLGEDVTVCAQLESVTIGTGVPSFLTQVFKDCVETMGFSGL